MKLTTDAILFGAWNEARQEKNVLDIGTGTGLLALMWAYKLPEALITAIEPENEAAEQARQNFLLSDCRDRLQIFSVPLQEFKAEQPFDLLLCNPPFFEPHTSSPDPLRSKARSRISLLPEDLFFHGMRLLAPGGRMLVLWPASDQSGAIELAASAGLHLRRLMQVKSRPAHTPHVCLMEYSPEPGALTEESICIHSGTGNTYSAAFMQLTGPYYLRFPSV